MEEFTFTKKEQAEAVNKIVELMNKYKITVVTEQDIRIVPLDIEEAKDERK